MVPKADWIAVDWGTTRLRVWAMAGRHPVAQAESGDGMDALEPGGFETALLRLVEPWLAGPTTIVACGMVGARQGWIEAPYRGVPCRPLGPTVRAPAEDPRLGVRILPGVKQARPADVMRGEETQIAGYLALHPGFDGVLCLPGTHTKWVQVSAGEIVSFRTAMTGELFGLLSRRSVLRHGVAEEGWDEDAFAVAVGDALARPESLASRLFGIRAEGLLSGLGPEAARARLSGLLIGTELAAMRPYWLGQAVALVGAADLTALYANALTAQGLAPKTADGPETTLAGLMAATAQASEDP